MYIDVDEVKNSLTPDQVFHFQIQTFDYDFEYLVDLFPRTTGPEWWKPINKRIHKKTKKKK